MVYCLVKVEGRYAVVEALEAFDLEVDCYPQVAPIEAPTWQDALAHYRPIARELHVS